MAEQIEEVSTEKKSGKPWIWIVMGVLLIVAGAGGGYFFAHQEQSKTEKKHDDKDKPEGEAKAEGEAKPEGEVEGEAKADTEAEEETDEHAVPVFVPLEAFTINLQPDGQFLQVTFNVQVKDEKTGEELKVYMPQIRSRLLLLLSNKTATELVKHEGKINLVKEIKQQIELPFKKGAEPIKITEVLITSFIIQ